MSVSGKPALPQTAREQSLWEFLHGGKLFQEGISIGASGLQLRCFVAWNLQRTVVVGVSPCEKDFASFKFLQIVENSARSDILDIEEKLLPTPFVMEKAAILIASTNTPARYKETWRNILNKYKQRIILDAGQLREKHPNCIPVTVEKDARSDIPDIDTKKLVSNSLVL
ncbi:hypothetical protein ACE6H2_023108 [Prunus campanulata]